MNETGNQPRRLWFWWVVFAALIAVFVLIILRVSTIDRAIKKNQPGLYNVLQVADGDTVIVDMNGTRETIRMIGVDTPETHHPDRPLECYGQEATDFTKKLIGKSKVRLEADSLNTNRDRYERLLRYVYLPDGTLLEERMINEGYGFAYTFFPFSKLGQFSALEEKAKQAKRGLWSFCQVLVKTNGAKQTNPL